MEWLSFWGSILGGLIGGFFTFICVKMTLKSEKEKEEKNKREELYRVRPRLEVINKTDYINVKEDESLDIDNGAIVLHIKDCYAENILEFYYDENCLIKTNLCYKEFEFENTGNTEIDYLYVTTNHPKRNSLVNIKQYELLVKEKMLNYDLFCSNRFIKKGERLKLRIYYLKDDMPNTGGSIEIWLKDINGNLWGQPLFVNDGYIENSTARTSSELRDYINISRALECFKNPYLW